MTQEEKQLLLTDLCARLPYGVKVENTSFLEPQIHTLFGRVSDDEFLMLETYKSVGGEDYRIVTDDVHYTGYLERIKPYLRPISSMTEEEKAEMSEGSKLAFLPAFEGKDGYCTDTMAYCAFNIDFCLKHHLDYRGLIEKGLALESPEGRIYKEAPSN